LIQKHKQGFYLSFFRFGDLGQGKLSKNTFVWYLCLMMRFYFVLFCTFYASLGRLSAQILNVERERQSSDSIHYFTGNASLNFSLFNRTAAADDPTRLLSANANAQLSYVADKNMYMWLNHLEYLEINNEAFNNFAYTHLRANFLHKRPLSYEVFAQYQYDLLRGLDRRLLAGAGLRWRLLKNKHLDLHYGLGGKFEEELWQEPKSEEPLLVSTYFWKSTQYLSLFYRINEQARLNTIVYHQATYDQTVGYFRQRYLGDVQLTFKLSKWLSFRSTFNFAYDNAPIVEITKFIYNISNGIQVSF